MDSIKRLRKYANGPCVYGEQKRVLGEMADAIDAEVEQLREREYQNGREDARDAVEFADRLCRASERREDVTLWGVDYMPYPLDADGVPIHVGDVMEWVDSDGEVTVTCTVDAVGVGCFFAWDNANGRFAQKCANAYRHCHAPAVEDVLREFAEKITDSQIPGVHPTYEEAIAEYTAKLRLVEGEDA